MQQHNSKYFVRRPLTPSPPPPTLGSKFNFFRLWSLNAATWQQMFCPQTHSTTTLGSNVKIQLFQNKVIKCSNMVANILPVDPYPLGMGSKGQNSTFSEHNHGAYQIKCNHKCSNMIANILPADPAPPLPPTLGCLLVAGPTVAQLEVSLALTICES